MRCRSVAILFLVLLASGCASLKVPTEGSYPFRAEFQGRAQVNGEEVGFQGAMSIVSNRSGSAQIYGPLGLVLYTMDISDGKARLYNVWGTKIREYEFDYEEFMGLMAGIPPDTPYLWKRQLKQGMAVSYLWGRLVLDEHALPREVHVRSSPPVNASFTHDGKIITLMMDRGSDTLQLSMFVIQGGRWLKGSLNEKGGS
ncbi:MAG TPA: hypothetical protein PKM41_03885 [Deltaproteobacteria bacterium]|jgi:hypothetical protein|nr:hypothetical protein [Deltaproteobacteria bacterium]HOI06054.1 hypothetical protein [Deltaproteobacteria bacterium]